MVGTLLFVSTLNRFRRLNELKLTPCHEIAMLKARLKASVRFTMAG